MLRAAVISLILSSTATSAAPAGNLVAMTAIAKRIIQSRVLDPASLQVRGGKVITATINGAPRTILCGEFNSKNRFGGYVGFRQFAYETADLQGVLVLNPGATVDFLSSGALRDFNHDVETSIRNGANADLIGEDSRRAYSMAQKYLVACVAAG